MNPLAEVLNQQLDSCIAGRMLSDLGRRIFFPKGIVAQSAEAKERAKYLNATIGMAYKNKEPLSLPLLRSMLPQLGAAEAVAYAPTGGLQALRLKWKELQQSKNPSLAGKDRTLPMVVAGLTSGIFQMAELFVNPGDRIVTPDMYWGNYRLIISERRGGIIDAFPLFNSAGGFNLEAFKSQLSKSLRQGRTGRGKAIVLLNFPNNPTGYSPSTEEAKQIAAILKECAEDDNDILTVHDDAYFALFYDEDLCTESLFAHCTDLHPNILALKVDGATKEDYAWGFRVGFMTFASKGMSEQDFAPLLNKLMGSIRATVSNCSGLSQNLLLKMLNHPNYFREKLEAQRELESRYHAVKTLLEAAYRGEQGTALSQLLSPLPFNSGYFMAFKAHAISAEDLRLALLNKGIGSIAIGDDLLRIAFSAVDQEDIGPLYNTIFDTAKQLHAQ